MSPGEIVASALVLVGSALALLAGIGVVRLPDVFARMHAATKPATLGLMLICIGAAVTDSDLADISKLVLVVALQFLTAPVGGAHGGPGVLPRRWAAPLGDGARRARHGRAAARALRAQAQRATPMSAEVGPSSAAAST